MIRIPGRRFLCGLLVSALSLQAGTFSISLPNIAAATTIAADTRIAAANAKAAFRAMRRKMHRTKDK